MARDISRETDIPLLQQAVRLLEQENRRLVQEIVALTNELAELRKSENPSLEVQLKLEAIEQHLAKLQKMTFGPSSERTKSAARSQLTVKVLVTEPRVIQMLRTTTRSRIKRNRRARHIPDASSRSYPW